MFSGLNVDDMCIDYKLKFGFKTNKLSLRDIQLGAFINREGFSTYKGLEFEYYLHISLFKWCISIGWFLEAVK